jgi:hypothetical protein
MIQALTPESALLSATALAVFVTMVLLFVRSPAAGVSALAAGQAWETVMRVEHPVLDLGIKLYPLDLLTLCAAVAAAVSAMSMVRHPVKPSLGRSASVLLGLLVLASLASGMARYGVQAAGNEARLYFLHPLGAAWYVATVRSGTSIDRTMTRVWIGMACVFSAAAVFWWLRLGIGTNSSYVVSDGQVVNSRPVDAAAALVVVQGSVMLLGTPVRVRAARLLAGPLLVAVVLLQHRSAWLAAMVMVPGWLLFRPGSALNKAAGIAVAAVLATSAVFAALFLPDSTVTNDLAASASNQDTMQWRMDSWHLLIGRLHGVQDWLFGMPFGSGFERLLYGSVVDSQPHNFYVHLLLRVGLVGLCTAVVLVLATLHRTNPRDPMGLVLWLAMAGDACFCLTYALPFLQSLLIGLLLRQPRVGMPMNDRRRPPSRRRVPDPRFGRPVVRS